VKIDKNERDPHTIKVAAFLAFSKNPKKAK
jgi:hypothetical protein